MSLCPSVIAASEDDDNDTGERQNEPCHEIIAIFVLRKFILQTRMRSHPVGLDVRFFVGPFVYFHTSYVRTAQAIAGRLRDKYHNLTSWLK